MAHIEKASIINGIVMLGAIFLAAEAAVVAAVVAVGTVLVEAGLTVSRYLVQSEIDQLQLDTPLEYWLKSGYWGTVPYTLRQIEDGFVAVDYRELKDDLEAELAVLHQMLYAFQGRLSWIRRSGVRAINGEPEQYAKYEPELVLDVLLPNPGGDFSRIFVQVSVDEYGGRRRVLVMQEIPVHEGRPMQPLPQGVRLFRLKGQQRAIYYKVSPMEQDVGCTIRLRIAQALLPQQVESVNASVVFDPQGGLDGLIPSEGGVSVHVDAKDELGWDEYAQECEAKSLRFIPRFET